MPALVSPRELVAGGGRGQKLRGRILCVDREQKGGKDCFSCYLVSDEGYDSMVYIEAWREHARTIQALVTEKQVVEITNLTIKALGDKVQWQSSSLEVYGQVLQGTRIEEIQDDPKIPSIPGMVLLEDLPSYKRVPHLINIAGIVVDIQV